MAIEFTRFSPKAMDFLRNSQFRLNILDGAVRSGKTIDCTVRWLQFLVDTEHPSETSTRGTPTKGDFVMIGKTSTTLYRNVLTDLFDIVGPKNYHWVNRQQGELEILGKRVWAIGASNEGAESKLRGATFAGALCDEVSLYPESVFTQLMARLSPRGAKCFCNTNPDSPTHWFYKNYLHNSTIQNKHLWHFFMEDNYSLDPEYIESLKQMYRGVWYRRMILGEWAVAEGLVYNPEVIQHNWPAEACNPETLLPQLYTADGAPEFYLRYGLDFGFTNPTAFIAIVAVPPRRYRSADGKHERFQRGAIYVYDEIYKANLTNQQIYTELSHRFPQRNYTNQVIYSDSAEPKSIEELRNAGLSSIRAAKKSNDSIRAGIQKLQDYDWYVSENCPNTSLELQNYAWNDKNPEDNKPLENGMDHLLDAVRYAMLDIDIENVGFGGDN